MISAQRLYETFLPKEYTIELKIVRTKRVFDGRVTIVGHKPHNSGRIGLHCKDLTIHSVHVNGTLSQTTTGSHDVLYISHSGKAGDYEIVVKFRGKITDTMHGLYPGKYQYDGIEHEVLSTQFESHHAREVFPCIDEPEAKATFNLIITTDRHLDVISNMPLHKKSQSNDIATHYFKTTPRMSTYLLAFVIGRFHHIEGATSNGVQVAVHATMAQPKKNMHFALDIAIRTIDFLEEYFGVPYPLPKSDHIALPEFSAGAMENWGLITYRERALLADSSSPQATKELIATVIAHEIAHQWFGNLVTMKWWDDLWLNESFANVMEYIVVDALHPEWHVWQEFVAGEVTTALNSDYIGGVQPVHSVIRHPDEISVLFDPAIVYAKGSRLLKMLREYIGEEAFRKGLKEYFITHAYGNTTSADLWRSFSSHTDVDVEQLMSPWIKQSGFPVVSVNTTQTGYTLTQLHRAIGHHTSDQHWTIPLSPVNTFLPAVLSVSKTSIHAPHRFPLLNKNGSSHFVTLYDNDALSLVVSELYSGQMDGVNRLLLLFEQVLLAKLGSNPYIHIIDLLEYYSSEREQAVWTVIAHTLRELRRFTSLVSDSDTWNKYVQRIVLPSATELTTHESRDESEADKKMRLIVYTLLLEAGHESTIQSLLQVARTKDLTKNHPLRSAMTQALAQYGNKDDFMRLFLLYKESIDPHLRQDLADGLACTTDEDHIAILIHALSDSEIIKPQDITRWYVHLSYNPSASNHAWHWMKNSWGYISKIFDGDKSYDAFPRYTARRMNSESDYREYCSFFEPKLSNPALRRAITIGKTELQHRSQIIERQHTVIINKLQELTR